MFHARQGVGILAICTGWFRSDFAKFDAFEMQQCNDTTLLQFHRSDTFRFFPIDVAGMAAEFPDFG
jgi:hypothetical protein